MKFKTLAIAIAAATVSTAAMADGHMSAPELKISGDVTVGYFDTNNTNPTSNTTSFGGNGSEVIFNAEQKVGNITYFGSVTANIGDDVRGDGNWSTDDQYIGFKGAFGEVRMGDTDNGCDVVDTGWVVPDEIITSETSGCGVTNVAGVGVAGDQNNLTYRGSRGPISYAVSYSPDVDFGASVPGEDTYAFGAAGKVGPATVSLGYVTAGDDRNNTVLGVSGNFGPVAVGARASKVEDGDTIYDLTASYAARGNTVYAAYSDADNNAEQVFLGYQRSLGSNTTFILEYVNTDASAVDDQYAIALKHAF